MNNIKQFIYAVLQEAPNNVPSVLVFFNRYNYEGLKHCEYAQIRKSSAWCVHRIVENKDYYFFFSYERLVLVYDLKNNILVHMTPRTIIGRMTKATSRHILWIKNMLAPLNPVEMYPLQYATKRGILLPTFNGDSKEKEHFHALMVEQIKNLK